LTQSISTDPKEYRSECPSSKHHGQALYFYYRKRVLTMLGARMFGPSCRPKGNMMTGALRVRSSPGSRAPVSLQSSED
jgi:hypothetical protein